MPRDAEVLLYRVRLVNPQTGPNQPTTYMETQILNTKLTMRTSIFRGKVEDFERTFVCETREVLWSRLATPSVELSQDERDTLEFDYYQYTMAMIDDGEEAPNEFL